MSVGDIFIAVTMELWSKYPKYQYMSVLHSQRAGASFQPHIHLVYSCTFILQYSHSVTGMQHCHSMYQKRVFFQICHITAFFSDFCFFQIGNLTMALLLFPPSAHKQHRAQRMQPGVVFILLLLGFFLSRLLVRNTTKQKQMWQVEEKWVGLGK